MANDNAKHKLHIAWTVDDGPSLNVTDKMIQAFNTAGEKPIPATWFIQWHKLDGVYLNKYKKLTTTS